MTDAEPMSLAAAQMAIRQAVARLQVQRIRAADDDERAALDAQMEKLNRASGALNRAAQQGHAFDESDLATAESASTIAKLRKRQGLAG